MKHLRETQQREQNIVEPSPDAIVMQVGEQLMYASSAAVKLFGADSAEQLTGLSLLDLIHPDFRGSVTEWVQKTFEQGIAMPAGEIKVQRLDGTTVDVELAGALVDHEGCPGVKAVMRDIARRKRAEKDLERLLSQMWNESCRLEALMSALPVGVAMCDLEGGTIASNEAFDAIWGAQRPSVMRPGEHPPYKAWWPDTGQPVELGEWASVQACLTDETVKGQLIEIEDSNGIRRFVHNSDSPVRDISGKIIGTAVAIQDITELRQAELALRKSEEALRQANEQLEEKVRERTAQLAQRASQLRALAEDLTLTEQRERGQLAKILHDHLQQLLVSAKYHINLLEKNSKAHDHEAFEGIEYMLADAIKVSRDLTVELSPPILREGGFDICMDWLARWMADKHGLLIDLSIEEDIPSPVEDVKLLLFESVRELLLNVSKHARVNKAGIEVSLIKGPALQIKVSDHGCGFEPLALKPAGEPGGGFGLFSICERLDMIGGRMDIKSAPGQGSSFLLTTPLAPAAPATLPVAGGPAAAGGRGDRWALTAPGERIRILLVDDHYILREGLAIILGAEPDMEIIGQASDGHAAVALTRELRPHVVLMDITLAGLNGIEATTIIHAEFPEICIIGLSMYTKGEMADAMQKAGAAAYLEKSGPVSSLIDTIRSCMFDSLPGASIEEGSRTRFRKREGIVP